MFINNNLYYYYFVVVVTCYIFILLIFIFKVYTTGVMIAKILEGSVFREGAYFPSLIDGASIPKGFGMAGEWPVLSPEGLDN